MKYLHKLAKLLVLITLSLASTAHAQKTGGTLRLPLNFSPGRA